MLRVKLCLEISLYVEVHEFIEFLREKHPEDVLGLYEEKENVQELQGLRESEAEAGV